VISILKIEIDGHFHGGEPVKPWVAEITGPDPKWGLARRFLEPMNDWSQAHAAWSGNVYGRVAHFHLRDGNVYEVQRCRGNSSRRRVVREFVAVERGKQSRIEPDEALARADGGGPASRFTIQEDLDGTSWVARVTGLGTPDRLGFVVVNGERIYRLKPGVYEIVERGERRFMGARSDRFVDLDEQEAWSWISPSARSA
jgi:hypothetical protein